MEEWGKIQFYVIVLQILAFCIAEVSKQFARFSDLTADTEGGVRVELARVMHKSPVCPCFKTFRTKNGHGPFLTQLTSFFEPSCLKTKEVL